MYSLFNKQIKSKGSFYGLNMLNTNLNFQLNSLYRHTAIPFSQIVQYYSLDSSCQDKHAFLSSKDFLIFNFCHLKN